MRHAIKLFAQRGVELWMAMPVQIAPHTAEAIEILAAVDINQRATVGALDHQRLIFSHLRESVPNDFTVPAEKFVASHFLRAACDALRFEQLHHRTATGVPTVADSA